MERVLTMWMEHCQSWGRVWFGTLFWGSVLGAATLTAFPDGNVVAVYVGTVAFGAALGLVAKARGRWL